MILQESGEMYLETILILSESSEIVRAVDISNHMSFSKPSVSRALAVLKSGGFISVKNNGAVVLTDSGLRVAKKILERHRLLSELLMKIGVDEQTAITDACKIEHVISDASFDAIKKAIMCDCIICNGKKPE